MSVVDDTGFCDGLSAVLPAATTSQKLYYQEERVMEERQDLGITGPG